MRTQPSPAKGNKTLPTPPAVTLAVVTHYTHEAYHAHRMEVVKTCLDTMLAGAQGADYELIIWDNGSTPEFRAMLNSYNPAVLVLSRNIGPHNARYHIGGLAQGKYLCVTDDDIAFHPRWLEKQMKVIETYPNVGSVSGSPQRTAFKWATKSNTAAVSNTQGMTIKAGRFIPPQWEIDFCNSIGKNPTYHAATTISELDYRLEYKGVTAWGHGHHMQMFGYAEILRKSFFKTDYLLDNVQIHAGHNYNIRLDEAGYMNLTTHERTALHIGNVLDDRMREIMTEWQE